MSNFKSPFTFSCLLHNGMPVLLDFIARELLPTWYGPVLSINRTVLKIRILGGRVMQNEEIMHLSIIW